ncbi:MAG: hypothetical protein P0Y56_02445 [Candidatus Andeanibacterium colombiense]|uniref:Uncharacterized protein n=1 Tax=Candidatus Andeanibacterium colombiense TaxID=3121345 RepID=A0AAJ5X7R1_9SPHN|nr:MAG: hypothetical protein P0Y56_02445 [Sphingomonadaceae bacterium]
MTEQRTDRIETPDGNIHTTTIVTDEPRRSGVSGWFLMFVVLLAVVVALWVFMSQNNSEMAKDNAVAEAAGKVDTAAEQVGDAAAKVGDAAGTTAGAAKEVAQDAAGEVQSAASGAAR